MTQPLTILVATHYKPLASLLERAMQGRAIVRQVDPRAETVLNSVGINDYALVALHAGKGNDDWLSLLKALHASCPGLKTLAFGEATDVGAVARGVVHGLTGYVPLSLGTDLLEVGKAITNAVTGADAPADSVFGRVKAMLPSAKDGTLLSHSGKVVSAEDAIQQCVNLGLTPEEIAGYLGVSANDANKIAGKARRRPPVGLGMPSDFRLLRRLAAGALVAGLAIFAVNAQRRPSFPYELAPLTGTVTLDGKPIAQGFVRLTPDRSKGTKGPTGTGRLDSRGRFSINTAGHEGAVVGHHRVVVQPHSVPAERPSAVGGIQDIPAMYVRASTSGLKVEIKQGQPNSVSLPLITPPATPPAQAQQ